MDKKEIQVFANSEFGKIRTLEVDGKVRFVASDVAKALGYAKPANAVAQHCKYTLKQGIPHPQGKGMLEVNTIPEGDVYRLIAKSELPAAEKFESWVFDEVLPTIRKTGSYTVNTTQASIDEARNKRAEATLLNARTRQANLIWKIAANSSNELYKQAGEAIAMNMLAGVNVVELPAAEQRPNHELGYFCKFIGKTSKWASTLGRKLKKAGIEKTVDTGVNKVIFDKKNNQRDNFYWFDDYLLPKLAELFPDEYVAVI